MDWPTFIARRPEFAGYDATMGALVIVEATRQIDATLWGPLADDGISLLAAQKLAKEPSGNSAKLVNQDGSTVYDMELDRLRMDVSGGYRVT